MAAVILYPAIDLKDGACVRLLKGDMARATVFNTSPADQAAAFERAGFAWLHVVDLNGAIEGRSANGEAVRAILGAIGVPVQLGGGIRTRAAIDAWIDAGIARVVLGTAAVRDPAMVRAAASDHPGRIAVGIDVQDGRAAVEGWVATSKLNPLDLARRFEDAGVGALIVTDIARDGALTGVNVEAVGAMADAVNIPVIASGGMASVDDITALRARLGRPVQGAIIGRALYTGAITAADAMRAAA